VQVHVDGEDRDHEEQGDLDQQAAEVSEPALELRLGRAAPEPLGDLAEHGARAGLHDHRTARAAHHVRSLEQRVRSLRERCLTRDITRFLLGGVALPRQGGFVHEEVGGTEDPAVGRHGRTRREHDDVPWHEYVVRQLHLVPSRSTVTFVWITAKRLATALLARYSCRKPSRARPSTIARTIIPSVVSPRHRESVIANSKRITSGLRNWFSSSPSGVVFRVSELRLGPNRSR
jgi:hypothetical protein